jgi:hypothetical protein
MALRLGCKILGLICIVGMVVMSGCMGRGSEELMNSYNKAAYKYQSEAFIKKHPLYMESGLRVNCAEARQVSVDNWTVQCVLKTGTGGKQIDHDVAIIYSGGSMASAIMDNNQNLLNG